MRFLARSELLSTFFTSWVWQGRQWAKWRIPKYDPFYWINAHAHPVVSTYYPLAVIASVIGKRLGLDGAFRLLCLHIALHIAIVFCGWYQLTGLFGAITITLAGYSWKQQPCYQYTVAWFPWLLLGIKGGNVWLAGISGAMVITAGYYPIGLQILLIALATTILWKSSPMWIAITIILGSVQTIPFLKYLPKTIRAKAHDDIGRVPLWHLASLIFPKAFRYSVNGVGFWEMSYYIGLIPLFTVWYTTSYAWALVALSLALMLGLFSSHLPRIPARWSYTFQVALTWVAVDGLNSMHLSPKVMAILCLAQALDLWMNNKDLLVTRPYSELPKKPSWAFNTKLTRYLKENLRHGERVSGLPYPLFTGHVNELPTLGYNGGMQLTLMARWRGDKIPNGSGAHDWFKNNGDDVSVDRARIRFAFSRKGVDGWNKTPIRHLYENPRLA